ncbi:c-type cytochrome [Flavobacterium sp. A45]|uniref:c-type cytochrome n=1 Tax=Flavobacterium sp. A45 TaxID=1945862 RepID=UPI0009872F8A|nr:c-type cytochrome [Flavobacterium sp. A45]
MKTLLMKTVVLLLIFSSCKKQDETKLETDLASATEINKAPEGLKLMKQNCYACHSVTTKSHDEIIAPPMIAVKKRYLMQYNSKEDFVNAIVAYSSDPKAENALMIGAVNKFNPMPKQNFKENDLKKIASYIYDNQIEAPKWFQNHFQQNHGNGQGMGNGNKKAN